MLVQRPGKNILLWLVAVLISAFVIVLSLDLLFALMGCAWFFLVQQIHGQSQIRTYLFPQGIKPWSRDSQVNRPSIYWLDGILMTQQSQFVGLDYNAVAVKYLQRKYSLRKILFVIANKWITGSSNTRVVWGVFQDQWNLDSFKIPGLSAS